MMVLCIALITLFPELATWLPDALIGVTQEVAAAAQPISPAKVPSA